MAVPDRLSVGAGIRPDERLGGRYRILRKIGAGAMADVYEVEHLRLASPFAAKVLRQHHADSIRRFLREARLLAQLKSDHIVTVFDVGDPDEEAPFYVMELLDGQDLRRLLDAVPELSIERAVKIISDACRGIGVAHAAGLVHRDLKPDNLFVTHRDTGEEIVKLLDFGVAKAEEGTSTEHGALIGTVRYMAPEQIAHAGVVSARADVRGLGAILYECLAGRPPHVADSIERLLFKILNEPVEPVRTHRPSIPVELDDVILRALERDPTKRFATANEFARALQPFSATPAGSLDLTLAERPPPRMVRRTRTRALRQLGVLGGAAAFATIGSFAFERAPSTERDEGKGATRPSAPSSARAREAAAPSPAAGREAPPVEVGPMPSSRSNPPVPSVGASKPSSRRPASNARSAPIATAAPPSEPLVKIDPSSPYEP
jgi:serine/threonine-protein kinase